MVYTTDDPVYTVPLYIQIAEGLIGKIESGELTPGDRLPPERDLSEQLGVNRMTLRRALRVLEAQGLIKRRHGVGTYITAPKIDRQMDIVFRFTHGMQTRGYNPGTRLISVEQVSLETAAARQLAVPLASPAYRIRRLRMINQDPVLLEDYTIPLARFPDLERFDLEQRSIYEVMESEYGIAIVRARQSFEPVVASEFEAGLLQIRPGAPLMLEKRLSYDQYNQPVEYGQDRYRGDRFRFITDAAPFELHLPTGTNPAYPNTVPSFDYPSTGTPLETQRRVA
jgi:GntR family transcriptional regulator, N-acetylglucosamine utilization regulator